MTIHATAITFHGCKIHLEPTGPEPAIAEQRYRYHVEHCASTEAILSTAIRQWVRSNEPDQKATQTEKPTRYITTARVARGQVEIAADSDAARAEARAILEGHKETQERIAVLDSIRAELSCIGPPGAVYHDEAEAVRALKERMENEGALRKAMAEQSATYKRERDEARQMHKERVFWEKAALNDQIAVLGERLTKMRIAAQAIIDKQAPYFRELVDDLRKAMG